MSSEFTTYRIDLEDKKQVKDTEYDGNCNLTMGSRCESVNTIEDGMTFNMLIGIPSSEMNDKCYSKT